MQLLSCFCRNSFRRKLFEGDTSSHDQQPSNVELPAEGTNMNRDSGTAVVEPNNLEEYASLAVLTEVETKSSLVKSLIFTKKLTSTKNNDDNNNNNQLKRPTNFKMPIPKLSKSVTISNAYQVSKNFDEKDVPSSFSGAPLAESESFIIENSPIIEIAPKSSIEKQKLSKLPIKLVKFTPNSRSVVESKVPASKPPVYPKNFTPRMNNTFAESRLKNSSKYTKMQTLIYGKFEKAAARGCSLTYSESGIAVDDIDPMDENRNFTSKNVGKLHINPSDSINNNNTTPETVKSGQSTSGSDAGNSSSCKIPSPNGSFVRGIIDDEIHDQPDLSVGYQMVATGNDQASNTCTPISMDDVAMTSYVSPPSPLNCDYESPFSPCAAAERQRSVSGRQFPTTLSFPPKSTAVSMSESIYSRYASSSVPADDFDDSMLDFNDESRRSSVIQFVDNTLPKKSNDEKKGGAIIKPVDEER
uniref:Uncharacterized protein n=1 Tax=Romanomermis culicivorax TaxID=13658 RepID=A0A915HZA1_ROMCU